MTQPLCPHCQTALTLKKGVYYCARHGVLLRLSQFENMTSRKFSQRCWTAWYRLVQRGGVRCPDCLSRMIILNPEDNKRLELDCCPECYAIWLDKGESPDLYLAFVTFEALEREAQKQKEIASLQYLIGKELVKRDKRISRYKKITALGATLSARVRAAYVAF